MRLAATFWGTRQGAYTRHLSRASGSGALPPRRRHYRQRRRFTLERTEPRAAGQAGTSWASWTVAIAVVSFLAILRRRGTLRRKAARWPAATLVAVVRWRGFVRRREALATLPNSSLQELEAAAAMADIVQGLGLQYFCREGNLDGLSNEVRTLRGVVARHLDVDLRRGLPGSYQKRLLGLAGAASTPWGRAIRASPQLKSILSQDWAIQFSPDYHLVRLGRSLPRGHVLREQVLRRRWFTGGGQQVERHCALSTPTEEELVFQRQLDCPFRADTKLVFLHIRAKESARVHSPPPPDIAAVVRDSQLPASLRDWLVLSCIV
ncbi:hypothetical protein CYMTET_14230 [Cymbomonas tetramitiformis]|uniref:Uncharacterized protein n=1 Tax=Cymbomonas tetramitiformis TaxID=36881 RepID=A0AAE0LAE5_9CHLO|nr:hypothetical protein CYMTET_14230 [Cymbomonas tetramitiformis]